MSENDSKTMLSKPAIWLVALMLLGGAVLRWAYFQEARTLPDYEYPALDAQYHDYWARAIVTGDWTPPEGQPYPEIEKHPYVRSPLYPFFLAGVYSLTGLSYDAPRLVQSALGLLSAFLAYLLGRRWFGQAAGLAACLGMSFYWIFPYYESQLIGPALVIPLLLLWLGLMSDAARPLRLDLLGAGGLILGVAALARPNLLLMIPATLVWLFAAARKTAAFSKLAAGAVVFLFCAAAGVSPGVIRNLVVSGQLVPVTAVGGQNLYLGNNELSDGHSGIAPDIRNWSSFDHARLVRELGESVGKPLTYAEANSIWTRRALKYISRHPLGTLQLTMRKILLMIGPKEVSVDREDEFERTASPVLRRLPGSFPFILALGLAGVALLIEEWRRADARQRIAASLLVLTLAVYGLSYLPFTITGRYRVPLTPLLILLGAYAVQRFADMAVRRDWKAVVSWCAAAILGWLILSGNFADYHPSEARWNLSRGLASGRAGDMARAESFLAKASALDPQMPKARLNYGIALARLGKTREALEELQAAAELEPTPLTWQSLGRVRKQAGDVEAAEEAYRAGLNLNTYDAGLHNDLGILLAEQGRLDEAIQEMASAVTVSPDYFDAHRNLAAALENAGRYGDAREQYSIAVKQRPHDGDVAFRFARRLALLGEYRAALPHLYIAINDAPDNPERLGALAWIRATHPDASLRDGKEAVFFARRASDLLGNTEPSALVVLAAANAEMGEVEQAAELIRRALSLLPAEADEDFRRTLQDHLAVYEKGEAYRDASMVTVQEEATDFLETR
ncbi:MAG: tetratricopeptide repeat protein [Verrucomicrobia bacterium]|nr:tetratricopeptide repeat protein [Verrucomicrobiota bacterium]